MKVLTTAQLPVVLASIGVLMVGIFLVVFPTLFASLKLADLGHARLALILSGPWVAAVGGGAWAVVRWAARKSGPHVLHEARKAAEEESAGR